VQERCPHRGTSLAYGLCEPDGIRCAYHGWKFAPSGACLDLPAEPDDSPLHRRARVGAYPARELGGLVFAYLGPEPAPLLPRWDVLVWDGLRDIGQATLPCNWLQIMENSVDPHHTEWLHGHHLADVQARQGRDRPQHYLRAHEKVGFDVFRYGIIKRRVLEGGSEDDDDWQVGHPLLFPNALRVGEHGRHRMQIRVPIDDTHTWHVWYSCYRIEGVDAPPQPEVPLYDVPWRDANGDFIVDFVDGGDIMAWVTQGAIADRTREMLGASDRGIALYRRLLLDEIEKVARGEDPLGLIRDPAENEIVALPQERDKYGAGADFLLRSLQDGHARFSPLGPLLREYTERAP
jgi:5,5'-dehydrodivanillate O-demethylase